MIGMSCTRFGLRDPRDTLSEVSKHFGHWEIFSEFEQAVTGFSRDLIEDLKQNGMTYSVHAPIGDVNIASLNDRMRESAIAEIISTIECANKIDADIVTIHPGIYSMVLRDTKDNSIVAARSSLKRIDKAAWENGVTAAVENMPLFPIMMGQTPHELHHLLDGTDLSVCFDIGHANTVGVIEETVALFLDRIVNVHIHDNMGKEDSHLTIGDGNIDFAPILSSLKAYRGNYIIESMSLESAIESKKRLEKMLSGI